MIVEGTSVGVIIVIAWNCVVEEVRDLLPKLFDLLSDPCKLFRKASVVNISQVNNDSSSPLQYKLIDQIEGVTKS